jgi:hypothetical protein
LATSPAINAASASYPAILDIANIDDDPTLSTDISGLLRPVSAILKDVGCSEYTSGTTINHPLAKSEVGPSYLKTTTNTDEIKKDNANFQIFPNPVSNRFTVEYYLATDSKVSIEIFSLNGMNFKNTLAKETQTAGNHNQSFDISSLKSGAYLVRLTTDSFLKSTKFIVN